MLDNHHIIKKGKSGYQSSGSMLTWQDPSLLKVQQWFGGGYSYYRESSSSASLRGEYYNHGSAGMTEPVVDLSLSFQHGGPAENDDETRTTTPWPTTSVLPNASWRRIRLRSSVGRGVPCYQRCRDAALAWEFRGQSKGMIQVPCPDSSPTPQTMVIGTPSEAIRRRLLITYSKIRLLLGRSLYVLNPVAVVYDVVDVKANDNVYTATAYGTMQGHWLRGEERVCVRYCNVTEAVEVEILSFSKPARSMMGYLVWPFIGKMQLAFFDQQMQGLKLIAGKSTGGGAF
jgi:uncharacterized protein (UPF0548 family)